MATRILLADDSVTIQKVVELTLHERGYQVIGVTNGDDALARAKSDSPAMVVADVHMPGASGYDVASKVKERSDTTPVLLLVGTFEPFDEQRFADSGADDYLLKPFESEEFLARVEALVPPDVDTPDAVAVTEPESAVVEEAPVAPEPPAAVESVAGDAAGALSDADIDRIALRVVERLSDQVVREIAGEIVPALAEAAVLKRIEELEQEAE